MKEASTGYNRGEIIRGLFCSLKFGAREVIREATPPEFRLQERRQPEECDHLRVDPQMQSAMDIQRLGEVRKSLRDLMPQGNERRGESPRVGSRPAIKPASVVRNRA